MAECLSAEYRAFVSTTDKLITGISIDPLLVGMKLCARKLTSGIPLSCGQQNERASELVRQVNSQVANFPEKYEEFVTVLKEVPSLEDLAKLLEEEREKIKLEDINATMQTQSDEQDKFSSQPKDDDKVPIDYEKFPYLNSDTISEEERKELIGRLEVESDDMKDEFAILVNKVKKSLERKNVACSDLSVLVRHSHKNRLLDIIEKHDNIKDLFLELANYWTFFDYDFLRLIIKDSCTELMSELTKYTSIFKEYCKRRLCEVPADVFASKGSKKYLCVKIDRNFTTTTLEDVEKLQYKLSRLLNTELRLLKVEEGCIKLTFNTLCEISTPLTPEQIEMLEELRVICVYSDDMEYFNSNGTSTNCRDFSAVSQSRRRQDFDLLILRDVVLQYQLVSTLIDRSDCVRLPKLKEIKALEKMLRIRMVAMLPILDKKLTEADARWLPQSQEKVCPRRDKHLPPTLQEDDSDSDKSREEKETLRSQRGKRPPPAIDPDDDKPREARRGKRLPPSATQGEDLANYKPKEDRGSRSGKRPPPAPQDEDPDDGPPPKKRLRHP